MTAAGRITKRADVTEIHHGVQCDGCNQLPLLGQRFRSQVVADYDLCNKCLQGAQGSALAPFQQVTNDGMTCALVALSFRLPYTLLNNDVWLAGAPQGMSSKATAKIHQHLADWVWQYFAASADGSDNAELTPTANHRETVRITGVLTHDCWQALARALQGCLIGSHLGYPAGKPPLYFQHEGHSRTIVGIERRPAKRPDFNSEFSLLVLDPSTHSKDLFNALRSQVKWQVGCPAQRAHFHQP